MTPEQRDAALTAAGITTAEVAKRAGVSWQHAHYVRRGDRQSPNVDQAMDDLLRDARAAQQPQPAAVPA